MERALRCSQEMLFWTPSLRGKGLKSPGTSSPPLLSRLRLLLPADGPSFKALLFGGILQSICIFCKLLSCDYLQWVKDPFEKLMKAGDPQQVTHTHPPSYTQSQKAGQWEIVSSEIFISFQFFILGHPSPFTASHSLHTRDRNKTETELKSRVNYTQSFYETLAVKP